MSRDDLTGILKWDQIEGWFNLPPDVALQTIVKQLLTGSKVVELGSYKSQSNVSIAAILPAESTTQASAKFDSESLDLSLIFCYKSITASPRQSSVANLKRNHIIWAVKTVGLKGTLIAESFIDTPKAKGKSINRK